MTQCVCFIRDWRGGQRLGSEEGGGGGEEEAPIKFRSTIVENTPLE